MTDCVEQFWSSKDLIVSFWEGFLKEYNKLMVDENCKRENYVFREFPQTQELLFSDENYFQKKYTRNIVKPR